MRGKQMKKIILLCCMSICSSMYGMMPQTKIVRMKSVENMQKEFDKRCLAAFFRQRNIKKYANKRCHTGVLRIVMIGDIERFNRNNAHKIEGWRVQEAFLASIKPLE